MALCNLQLRRLIIMVSLSMLSSATDHRHKQPDSDSSIGSHDVFNRTVVLNSASERYLAMIFHDYSENTTGIISAARFKDLLRDLSLGEEVPRTETVLSLQDQHRNARSYDDQESAFGEFARRFSGRRSRQKRSSTKQPKRETKSPPNLVSRGSPARSRDRNRRSTEDRPYSLDERNTCLEGQDLMNIHGVSETQGINQDDFVRICPSLIRQLQKGACVKEKPGSSNVDEHSSKMSHVWGYGILSITVISLTSLLAIAIIPLMGHSIYKKIMSFLVALAVGTLSGDALLHLIPHAFKSGHSHDHGEEHKQNIYKSCVIIAGIYVFFMVECAMRARMARRKRSQEDLHMCDEVTSPDKMSLSEKKKEAAKYQDMIGSRLAGMHRCISCDGTHFSKVSGHFSEGCKPTSCELVLVESGKEERASTGSESSREKEPFWEPSCHGDHCQQRDCLGERSKHSFSDTELLAVLQGKSCIHPNIYTNNNFSVSGSDSGGQTQHNVNEISRQGGEVHYSYPAPTETTTETALTSDNGDGSCEDEHDHEQIHHHLHHHHSHKIDKDTSIATVAWMVIVGDGFHNFSDGLAVGAAFSASLTGGLTTAIAVFCHELPHELGDFAILLKSGLTFRQALTYNLASAIISYLGLVLGIIIGDIHSAHTWVFALTAGMFLYISLVDMLPELGNYINEGGSWSVVLSQNVGILTGLSIMLVIALYET